MKFRKMFIYCLTVLLFSSCESGFEDMMDDAYIPTVTYISDGVVVATQTLPSQKITALPSSIFKNDYALAGWYTGSDGSGSRVLTGTEIIKDLTVYANWQQGTTGLSYTLISGNNYSVSKGSMSASATSLVIPDYNSSGGRVTAIAGNGFADLASLTSVIIPGTVTSIGNLAFMKCTALTDVFIPESVVTIGTITSPSFIQCYALKSITVDSSNTAFKDIDGVLYNKSGTTLITYPPKRVATSYAIPAGATTIGGNGLSYCNNLVIVTIPDSVTTIEGYGFAESTSLTGISIPDGVTSLSGYVFYGCTAMTSVVIGTGMTSINQFVFYHCYAVKSFTVKRSVAPTIDSNNFDGITGCTLYRYSPATGFTAGQWGNTSIFSSQVDL